MPSVASSDPASWHALGVQQVLECCMSRQEGLSDAEAEKRLAQHGRNILPAVTGRSPLLRFALQFHNVLIYVLLSAAMVTLLLAHYVDAGVILGVVILNAIIGFVQEGKAERALDAIRSMLTPVTMVLRHGERHEIPTDALVPGDIVSLAAGDKVPADLRLIETKNLRIEESILTGEAAAVEKTTDPVAQDAVLGDRFCLAYSGTLVVYGQGRGVVVATGTATEIGRISTMLVEVKTLETPLLKRMADFGRWLTIAIGILALVSFVLGVGWRGFSLEDMFLAAVGLAVAAIPEGLPAIMTITLAVGVQRMARRNAIIRRLPAVETLGSVTVICTDKTGTLTKNEMTAQRVIMDGQVFDVAGVGYVPHGGISRQGVELEPGQHPGLLQLARIAMLCNDAEVRRDGGTWIMQGDPTEGALVTLALKVGLDQAFERESLPRTDVIPFDAEHRFMATLHHDHAGQAFVFLKGAPEAVLARCVTQQNAQGQTVGLASDFWLWQNEMMAGEGLRVLATACKAVPVDKLELFFDDVACGFSLLGLVGIIDPPREEAIQAVAQCRRAGIRVKMITGDHVVTACAIADQLGLGGADTRAITGLELEGLDDMQLQRVVQQTDVFARASPEHKLRIVCALQAQGAVVAMTGDGVNDAPALKRADVGVAMGRKGTEVAKEAAEMVLADDNFASISHAIEEGRTVYDNIKKAIVYVLPTSCGEAGIILIAILLGIQLPVTPVQILWINMITAVTLSLSLAFLPANEAGMNKPPRDPAEPLISGFLVWRIVLVSVLMVLAALWVFRNEQAHGEPLAVARTAAINMIVMGEIVYLLNSRYLYRSILSAGACFGNRPAWISIGLIVPCQLALTYWQPMQKLFVTADITLRCWIAILLAGVLILLVVELEKWVMRNLATGEEARIRAVS